MLHAPPEAGALGRLALAKENHVDAARPAARAGRTAVDAGRNHGVEKEAIHAGIAPHRGFPKRRFPKSTFFGGHHPLSLGPTPQSRYPELAVKVRWGILSKNDGENILDTPITFWHNYLMEQKPKTLLESIQAYSDAGFALGESADSRWPKGVACVHCGADAPMFLKTRKIWKCSKCRKQFSFKAGTLLEDSPIGLNKWLPAIWMIANARNGISSHELGRALGVTQKTAWFMLHRIRLAMQDDLTGGNLGGEVEVDETFIGGKARNMHKDKKLRLMISSAGSGLNAGYGKAIVFGMLERGKTVRATVIPDRTKKTIQPIVGANVEPGSQIFSDEHGENWKIDQYTHDVVNHLEAYVKGNVHTNGIENFWSLLKRGINGTYVSVEPFHLFRYVDEQAFRYNNRKHVDGEVVSDYERFKRALSQVVGRRLTYAELTAKTEAGRF